MTKIINDIKQKSEGRNRSFQVGDRVIWKPIDRRDMSQDKTFAWYGEKGTVTMLMTLDRAYIALDDFPQCNDRERANRFCASFDELELIDGEDNQASL